MGTSSDRSLGRHLGNNESGVKASFCFLGHAVGIENADLRAYTVVCVGVRLPLWRHPSSIAQPTYGVQVLPPGYIAGTPAKTVVLAHGGPHDSWSAAWQGSWIDWAQILAARGYVVLLPNPRGSAGQGTGFARGVINGWGSRDYQDIIDGVDLLVRRGIADPAHLGIGGWSYGGYMPAWAMTHDTRFRTAVIGAAPTDVLTLGLYHRQCL